MIATYRRAGGGKAEPAVEFVEEVPNNRIQLVGDLRLALARAGTPPGLADDDLEHPGQRYRLQPGDLRRDGGGVADDLSEGGGLAVGQLQHQPVDGRADGRQVAEFATPEVRRDAADPGDGPEHEVADGSRRE